MVMRFEMAKTIFYDPNFGRTYSGTGNTFRTPEGHFGIVGKNGKVHYPAPARPAPSLSRVAPPANLSKRYGNDIRRGTTLDMKPDGSYKILGSRRGVSLPGYVGTVKYNPRGVNPVVRAGAHLGLNAIRIHPVTRTLNLAFDVANALDFNGEWMAGEKENWDDAMARHGFAKGCETLPETDVFRYITCRSTPNQCSSGPPASMQCSVGCGWPGQIPSGRINDNDEFTIPAETGYGSVGACWRVENIYMGPGSDEAPTGRMTLGRLYTRAMPGRVNGQPVGRPAETVRRLPKTPSRVLPARSAPPDPVISEKTTTPPRPRRRNPPYTRPAVEAAFGGARIPPRLTNHVLSPFDGRERKGNVGRSMGLALIAKLYDATTEAKEIVDILYDNLGTKCKGARSMSAKANCVYRNIGTLNVPMALAEIAKNHYEDKVFGAIYGTVGKNTKFGSMLPGTGPTRSTPTVRKR